MVDKAPNKLLASIVICSLILQPVFLTADAQAALPKQETSTTIPESYSSKNLDATAQEVADQIVLQNLVNGTDRTSISIFDDASPNILHAGGTTGPIGGQSFAFAVDTLTNELHYKDEAGQEHVGTYDAVKKSGSVAYADAAGLSVQVSVQFVDASGKSVLQSMSRTLRPASNPAAEPLETRFYAFNAAGNLFGYNLTAKKNGVNYTVYAGEAANGSWNVSYSEAPIGAQDLFHLGGLVKVSDLPSFADATLEALKQTALEKTTVKTEFKLSGGFFAMQSYRSAGGQFEDKVYFTMRSSGLTMLLVKGLCDLRSTESDDIVFNVNQGDLGLGAGYTLTFGEWVKDGASSGYGLLVQFNGQTVGLADYPRQDLVKMNVGGTDKIFRAAVDASGRMTLTDATAQIATVQNDVKSRYDAASAALTQNKAVLSSIETSVRAFVSAGSGDAINQDILRLAQEIASFEPDASVLTQAQNLKSQTTALLAALNTGIPSEIAKILPQITALRASLDAAMAEIAALKDKIYLSKNFAEITSLQSSVISKIAAMNGPNGSLYSNGLSDISSAYTTQLNAKSLALSGLETIRTGMTDLRKQAEATSLSKKRQDIRTVGDPIAAQVTAKLAEGTTLDTTLTGLTQQPIVAASDVTSAQTQLQAIASLNAGSDVNAQVASLSQTLAALQTDIANFSVSAAKTAVANWKTAVQASGTQAQTILNAIGSVTSFTTLEGYLTQINAISAKFTAGTPGSHIDALNALKAQVTALTNQRADLVTRFQNLQTQITTLAANANVISMRQSIHTVGDPIAVQVTAKVTEGTALETTLNGLKDLPPVISAAAEQDTLDRIKTISFLTGDVSANSAAAAALNQTLTTLKSDIARFDVTAVLTAVAQWKFAVQKSGTDAQSILNAIGSFSNVQTLADCLTQINAISAKFTAGTPGSHIDALNALKDQVTALTNQRAALVSRFQNLQSQITTLTADAVAYAKSRPINTYTGWTDSPYATVDSATGMTKLLFMFADYNFYDFLSSGGTEAIDTTTATMDGHHHNANPFESSDLYLSYLVPVKNAQGQIQYVWSAPKNMGLNTNKSDSSAMISADGKTVWMSRPLTEGSSQVGIEVATQNANGSWTQSKVNIPKAPDEFSKTNPHISADGKTLYYNVYYDRDKNGVTDPGEADLYYSTKNADGTWSAPISMGLAVNGASAFGAGEFPAGGSKTVAGLFTAMGDLLRAAGLNTTVNVNPTGKTSAEIQAETTAAQLNLINTALGRKDLRKLLSATEKQIALPAELQTLFTTFDTGTPNAETILKANRKLIETVYLLAAPKGVSFQDQIWMNAEGTEAYYTDGIANYFTKKVDGIWQAGTLILFEGKFVPGAEPSFTENGNRMYFMKIDETLRTIVLVTSYKLPNGTWSTPVPVEKAF